MLNDFVDQECEAFEEIRDMEVVSVPISVLTGLKETAGREHPKSYFDQLEYVRVGVKHFLYLQKLRKDIEPMKELLIRIEKIIGSECYNANIQNYDPRGVWQGEGRSFRYPVTLRVNDKYTHRTISSNVAPEVLKRWTPGVGQGS